MCGGSLRSSRSERHPQPLSAERVAWRRMDTQQASIPTLTDECGIERTLWAFPCTRSGVPRDVPISAREQRAIETELGMQWFDRTPRRVSLRRWEIVVGVCLGFAVLFSLDLHRYGTASILVFIAIAVGASRSLPKRPVAFLGLLLLVVVSGVESMRNANRYGTTPFGTTLPWTLTAFWFLLSTAPGLYGSKTRLTKHAILTSRPNAVRRAMLKAHRCPSCGHRLAETSDDALATLHCTHCGGVWKLAYHYNATDDAAHTETAESCPVCGYSLHGLEPDGEGVLCCPECGQQAPPTEQAVCLTKQMFCWGCGRSLRGLPLFADDRVRCPGCGLWRSGIRAGDVSPLPPQAPPDADASRVDRPSTPPRSRADTQG